MCHDGNSSKYQRNRPDCTRNIIANEHSIFSKFYPVFQGERESMRSRALLACSEKAHHLIWGPRHQSHLKDLLCVRHSALYFPCALSFYNLLILSWEHSARQVRIIKKKQLGSESNLSFSNSWSHSVENVTPEFTFSTWFCESHMKGHQMAPNGEFPQLSPLQMMQQQTTSSCEDMAFGDRKLQRGSNFTDIY